MPVNNNIENQIRGKTILVTGGTGSFGNAVVSRLLKMGPKQIIIFSRDEKKQLDMSNKFSSPVLKFVIGDVRDSETVDFWMRGVDLVFHAAALKQVPNCEFFPMEALYTNSLGAHNIIRAAMHHGVERVVVLSTDKAVHPINVMGMTKALMERIMIADSRDNHSKTILCGTRYGNVMYTRGSVIPYFVELMKAKKPLTITNRDMTRFMMPLSQSVDLVLFALAHGKNGEIFVRKSPAATVGDLTEAMASIFKYKKGVKEIGLRPGEKMHETLISSEEIPRTEDFGDYYKINPEAPEMDLKDYYFRGVSDTMDGGYTSENTKRLSVSEVKKLLLGLPEIKEELKNWNKK